MGNELREALERITVKARARGWKVAADVECNEIIKQCEAALNQPAPASLTAELLEPILWDYMYDDMEGRWPEMVRIMETDPFWANGKHRGDCTHDAHTCQRCLVESNKKDAAKLAGRIRAALAQPAKQEEVVVDLPPGSGANGPFGQPPQSGEAQPSEQVAFRDVHNLIALLRGHEENTGEKLEADDESVLIDIEKRWLPVFPAAAPASSAPSAEDLAESFHELYEELAPSYGYETRPESAVPWKDVPERNKRLMIAVCDSLRKQFQSTEWDKGYKAACDNIVAGRERLLKRAKDAGLVEAVPAGRSESAPLKVGDRFVIGSGSMRFLAEAVSRLDDVAGQAKAEQGPAWDARAALLQWANEVDAEISAVHDILVGDACNGFREGIRFAIELIDEQKRRDPLAQKEQPR